MISETTRISDALIRMQREHVHMRYSVKNSLTLINPLIWSLSPSSVIG
jgi:hypothetical protein